MDAAAAIAMGVSAYQTRLLFDKMKGQHPKVAATEGHPTEESHEPGGT